MVKYRASNISHNIEEMLPFSVFNPKKVRFRKQHETINII